MRDLTNLVGVSGDGPGRKGGRHEALQAAVSRWIRCGELNLHRKPVWQPVAKSRRDFRDRDEHPEIGRAHVELQSLMRNSYAVFCLKKNTNPSTSNHHCTHKPHNNKK